MPFTPFHLGPASVLALALLRFVYLPALLLGSIALDMQPFFIMFFNLPGTLHGPLLHSFIGATLLALPLTALVFTLRKPIQYMAALLKLEQTPTLPRILAGTLIGVYSHILLDSYLYTDIQPFYPLTVNPLLSQSASRHLDMYTACLITIIIATAMYAIYLRKKPSTSPQNEP